MRVWLPLALLCLAAASARAQALPEPSASTETRTADMLRAWLHAPDPRLRAWAAHDIAAGHAVDLLPELEAQLAGDTAAPVSTSGRAAAARSMFSLVDALIQLDAVVPAETLGRLHALGYGTEVQELILLARLPGTEAGSALFALYGSANPAASRVAAQMLALHPPPGFAARLLRSILVTGEITVHDPDDLSTSGRGGGFCCGVGGGAVGRDDWPVVGGYAFLDPAAAREQAAAHRPTTLFLDGPDPVFLLRTVSHNGYSYMPCGGFAPLNDALRSHLVGTLLHGAAPSPFPEQPVPVRIAFHSREAFRAAVQGFVDAQQENFSRVASALAAAGLLTEEERQASSLRLHLSLQDLRRTPREDLPALSFRPPVEWVPAF